MKNIFYLLPFLILLIMFVPITSYGQIVGQTSCLNDDGIRELDFRFVTGIQDFDESLKQVELTVNVDVEDDITNEPFQVHLIRYPHTGSRIIDVSQDSQHENFEVDNFRTTERRIIPIPNFQINLWPFETYTIPLFLEFDSDVRLCYSEFEGGTDDIHSYKAGYFPENPNWQVSINFNEILFSELEKMIPGSEKRFENSTYFQFDTIISHTDGYINKNAFYFIIPMIPILLIIGHGFFIRTEKLSVHVTFFTGVSILILTSLFAIKPSTPIDLTMIETISLSGIAIYTVGFFIFLLNKKKLTTRKNYVIENKIKYTKIEESEIEDRDTPFRNPKFVQGIFYVFVAMAGILTYTATTVSNDIVKIIASIFTVVMIGLAFAVLNKEIL